MFENKRGQWSGTEKAAPRDGWNFLFWSQTWAYICEKSLQKCTSLIPLFLTVWLLLDASPVFFGIPLWPGLQMIFFSFFSDMVVLVFPWHFWGSDILFMKGSCYILLWIVCLHSVIWLVVGLLIGLLVVQLIHAYPFRYITGYMVY